MAAHNSLKTSRSLLCRLRDWRDHQAWILFLKRYGPGIQATSCRAGLGPDRAEEVTQRVLCKLALRLRHFVYDPSRTFRGWLTQLVRREAIDYFRQNAGAPFAHGTGDSAVHRWLEQQPATTDDADAEVSDRQRLLKELAARVEAAVRARVSPESWQAFWLTEVEGLSTKQAAEELGKTFAATYMAAQRVRRQLRHEGESAFAEFRRRWTTPVA
jgi:RNA polymerase sigma-70 factor (ECF subfamily)